MKFFIAILGLTTIMMAVGKVTSHDSSESAAVKEYRYTLPISVVTDTETSDNVIDASKWVTDQTVVYNRQVNKAQPIYLTGSVINKRSNKEVAVFPTQNILFPCGATEAGTWEYVMVQTILQSLTPQGECPIEPGTYKLDSSRVLNISATFRDVLECGEYELDLTVIDEDYSKIVNVKYAFNTDNFADKSSCK